MKSILIKTFVLLTTFFLISSCTKDSDVEVPIAQKILFADNFDNNNVAPFTIIAKGWTTYAQTGTKTWLQKTYSNDGYMIFSPFAGSGTTFPPYTNVGWLISPILDMDTQVGEKLFFQSAQDGFVKTNDYPLELFIATNYDGVNFNNANWQNIPIEKPNSNSIKFIYIDSGIIDLSKFKGKLNFAFKVKGSFNPPYDSKTGGYQIDNVRVFY